MTNITPAILTDNQDDFLHQFQAYTSYGVEQIDIDINIAGDSFEGDVTLTAGQVIELLKQVDFWPNKLGIHLMTAHPTIEIDRFIETFDDLSDIKFYVHQESDIASFLANPKYKALYFGITVKAETLLADSMFYRSFPEIQLMTIETGKQGNMFKQEILSRVEWLREEGYEGDISLDGGVNDETARVIKGQSINRVSVGSYFSSDVADFGDRMKKLDKVLNREE